MRPRLLDLFCGAGGATRGYQEAGFWVVGVDHLPQRNYCGDEFIQADALRFLDDLLSIELWIGDNPVYRVDAIHASPPCQAYCNISRQTGSQADHPRLIEPTRSLLEKAGLPYVIENVPEAPLRNPLRLCGSSFGLRVRRHRHFECAGFDVMAPPCVHGWQQSNPNRLRAATFTPKPKAVVPVYGGGQVGFPVAVCREAMGIDWMTQDELKEAIPPAYTEHIGHYLLTHLKTLTPTQTA